MASTTPNLLLVCIGHESDGAAIEPLARALSARGFDLAPPSLDLQAIGPLSQDEVVIVVLSERMLGDQRSRAVLEGLTPELDLVPLSLFPGSAPALEDLSHIVLCRMGVDRAAERIAIIAEAGAEEIVVWNMMTARARSWEQAGQSSAGILSRQEVDRATALLGAKIARLGGADREALDALVVRSRERHRRRSRLVAGVGIVAAVLLLTSTGVAFAQSREASASASVARAAGSASEARRILDSADAAVDEDPDLPWLLAGKAIELSPSDEVLAEASRLSSTLIPHTTMDLRDLPVALSVSSGDNLAVVYAEAGFDVIDSATSSPLLTVTHEDMPGLTSVAISPDGESVGALDDEGRLRVLSVPDGAVTMDVVAPGSRVVSWIDNRRLLVARSTGYSVLDVLAPDAKSERDLGVPVVATSTSDSGGRVLVATSEGLLEVEPGSGEAQPLLDMTGIADVEASSDGTRAVVRTATGTVLLRLGGPGAQSAQESEEEPLQLLGEYTGARPGERFEAVLGTQDGKIRVVLPGGQIPSWTFPAHRGRTTGVAELPDGAIVSVGADSRLRVWHTSKIVERFPDGESLLPALAGFGAVDGYAESFRPVLGTGVGEADVLVDAPQSFDVHMLRRSDLLADPSGRLSVSTLPRGLIDSPGKPTEVPGRGVRFPSGEPGATVIWDFDGEAEVLPPPPIPAGVALVAIDSLGTWVALSNDAGMEVLDARALAPKWAHTSNPTGESPVAVRIGDDGVGVAVTTGGVMWGTDGRLVQVAPDGTRAVAAGFSDSGVVVTVGADGSVYRWDGAEGALIGAASADVGAFAVKVRHDAAVAAVIGATTTQIVDLTSGLVVYEIDATDEYRAVSDVAFDDGGGGFIALRNDGSVSRQHLHDGAEIGAVIESAQPRLFSESERLIFGLGGAGQ